MVAELKKMPPNNNEDTKKWRPKKREGKCPWRIKVTVGAPPDGKKGKNPGKIDFKNGGNRPGGGGTTGGGEGPAVNGLWGGIIKAGARKTTGGGRPRARGYKRPPGG